MLMKTTKKKKKKARLYVKYIEFDREKKIETFSTVSTLDSRMSRPLNNPKSKVKVSANNAKPARRRHLTNVPRILGMHGHQDRSATIRRNDFDTGFGPRDCALVDGGTRSGWRVVVRTGFGVHRTEALIQPRLHVRHAGYSAAVQTTQRTGRLSDTRQNVIRESVFFAIQ